MGPGGGAVSVRDTHTCPEQADRPSWVTGRRPRGRWRASGWHSRGAVRTPPSSPGAAVRRAPSKTPGTEPASLGTRAGLAALKSAPRLVAAPRGEAADTVSRAWSPGPVPTRGGRCPRSLGLPGGALALWGLLPQRVSPRGARSGGAPAARAGLCAPRGFVTPVARPGPPWGLAGSSAHRSWRRSPGTAGRGRGAQASARTVERAVPWLLRGSGGQGQPGTAAVPGVQGEDSRLASVRVRWGLGGGRAPGG